MAEYDRMQKKQESRAVANNGGRSKQLKSIGDKRPSMALQNKVIQGQFTAGIGADWHIHHADHIKYSANKATRVDFDGRTKRQIFMQLGHKINNNGLAHTTGNQCFIACRNWIRANIQ